jgi:F0F1-type ATP synthase assembly protein I
MDKNSLRQLIISSATYSLSSILGPLLLLGVPAYFLDKFLGTKPIILLISVFIAFITSNILLFKKLAKINQMISSYIPAKQDDGQDEIKSPDKNK